MKKLFIFLLTVILIVCPVFSIGASCTYNGFVELNSDIYLLVNADNGTVVFSQNSDKKVSPAAVVKMVTAIVVARNCKNYDELVTASSTAIHSLDGTGCIVSGIDEGEKMTVKDLLACMMLQSSNDAAVVLSEHFGKTEAGFVDMMNETAKELGCKNTLFTDSTGIDSEQYTTADDLVILAEEYIKHPELTDISELLFYDTAETNTSNVRELLNSNDMINYYRDVYYEYVNGIKDGYNEDTGRNAVTSATCDGYTYIAVVLNCPDKDIDSDGYSEKTAFYDCKSMFKWAFNNLSMATVADTSTYVGEVKVKLAKTTDYVRLVPANKVSSLVPDGVDASSVNFECDIPEYVCAPVSKGDVLGKAKIMYADEEIASVDLVAGEDVEVNGFLYFFHIIFLTLKSSVFLALFGIVVFAAFIYIFVVMKNSKKKAKKIKNRNKNNDNSDGNIKTKKQRKSKNTNNDNHADKNKKTADNITDTGGYDDIDFSLFE